MRVRENTIVVGMFAGVFLGFPAAPSSGAAVALGISSGNNIEATLSIGISPNRLAASGFIISDVRMIFERVRGASDAVQALEVARRVADELSWQLADARQALLDNPADEQARRELTRLPPLMEQAVAEIDARSAALRSRVLDGLGSDAVSRLESCVSVRQGGFGVPYQVSARSDAEWLYLGSSLRARQRADRLGTQLEAARADYLAGVEADPVFVSARRSERELAGPMLTVFLEEYHR